jgi:uncharacterized membrane protein
VSLPRDPRNLRSDTPPVNGLDARERSEARRMYSDADAERYDWLKWQEMKRWLVAVGGLLVFLSAVTLLLHLVGADAAGPVTILTSTAGTGLGFAVRSVLSRLRGGPPPG